MMLGKFLLNLLILTGLLILGIVTGATIMAVVIAYGEHIGIFLGLGFALCAGAALITILNE